MNSPPLPRYRHKKRLSRLSTDSVTPLPVYTSPQVWQESVQDLEGTPSDQPPDYPDSADEADADTEDFESDQQAYVSPLLSPSTFPRRSSHRNPARRRQQAATTSDPYLDALLERSVHALELSNTLLQSSMSTQSSLSNLLALDSPADRSLEARARGLSSRIGGDVHEVWMDDLDQITKGVDYLFVDQADEAEGTSSKADEVIVSSSLPAPSSIQARRARRRPSADLLGREHLHYSNHDRNHLIAPPPRALTLYVDSADDPHSIVLPSTLGLRTTSSTLFHDMSSSSPDIPLTRPRRSSSMRSASSTMSDRVGEPSTRAYDLLSTMVPTHARKERRPSHPEPLSSRITSPERRRRNSASRSRSSTPRRHMSPPPRSRPMTPPIEELSSTSASSSSDSQPNVSRTMLSLRKLLDEHSPPDDTNKASSSTSVPPDPPRPKHVFLPRSLPPPPASGTSTATASISRLFTKGTHHSSTRPPSPPRHSSMKQRSAPPTPLMPSPSSLFIPGSPFASGSSRGSAASSGRSTPKRISFAELPESYSGSRPGTSRFQQKRSRSRSRNGKGKGKKENDKEEASGWWTSWLLGASGTYGGSGLGIGAEDRSPEGASRGWGGKSRFGGTLDDWAI